MSIGACNPDIHNQRQIELLMFNPLYPNIHIVKRKKMKSSRFGMQYSFLKVSFHRRFTDKTWPKAIFVTLIHCR
ncbi:hypothetical protein P8452_36399 [Trifolium repens]|nr:hypothetical protein P8452_36399 [Trifolium repens]